MAHRRTDVAPDGGTINDEGGTTAENVSSDVDVPVEAVEDATTPVIVRGKLEDCVQEVIVAVTMIAPMNQQPVPTLTSLI